LSANLIVINCSLFEFPETYNLEGIPYHLKGATSDLLGTTYHLKEETSDLLGIPYHLKEGTLELFGAMLVHAV
jgi:hypothetical protein